MRLLDRLTGRAGAERFDPDLASGASVIISSFGSPDAEKVLPTYLNHVNAYKTNGVVFGVLLARLKLFSEASFKWQDLSTKELYGNEGLRLLEHPFGPNTTTGDLLARMEQDASLAGNSFTRSAGDRLERLHPQCVTIVSEITNDANGDEIRTVLGYLYEPPPWEGRDLAYYPADEVAHWAPIPDPEANFRGMSWLTPILREIDADTQMTDYKRAYLTNAATPNLIIKYKHKVGDKKLAAVKEQIDARHGGVQNAFRTLALDEGADTTVVGSSFEAMRFAETQAAGENKIAVAAGVPAIVAGLKEGLDAATYSNYGMAMRAFADLTMRPLWRSACAALQQLVTRPSGARLWIDTRDIAALQEGEKEQADTMAVLATAANAFVSAGFRPESIVKALSASDVTLLEHSGLVSVQLQAPGSTPPSGPGGGTPPAPVPPAPPSGGGRAVDQDLGDASRAVGQPVDVHVTVNPQPIELLVPVELYADVAAPSVTVEAPSVSVDAPVSVSPTPVHVEVPVAPPPTVIARPVVEVVQAPPRRTKTTVQRDAQGEIKSTTTTEE